MSKKLADQPSSGEGISEEEFFVQRVTAVNTEMEKGENLYPNKFEVTHTFGDILEHCNKQEGQHTSEDEVRSAGRIQKVRIHARFSFVEMVSSGTSLQIVLDAKVQPCAEMIKFIKRGDILGFMGNPGKTKTGEPSVFVKEMQILTPCLRTIPVEHYGLKDPEIIYRKRYLDLLMNKESVERFVTRTNIIKYIRNFLDSKGFLEVETPMMNHIPGGAVARPFVTYHNELKLDLYMRIAPELYLKKLIIGGFDKVFELGKQFRNEGIDLTHNPEFTSCEFYAAYADYEDMINLNEELIHGMVNQIFNTSKITYAPKKREQHVEPVEINFERPFARIHILEDLNKELGLNLTGENIEDPEILNELLQACAAQGLTVEKPQTLNRVLDKLIGHIIEPKCTNPTFLTGYPISTSPLAKNHRSEKGMVERFELFVNGKELCNGYTELINPFEQRLRFEAQARDKSAGDVEAMVTDEDFINALEYALPPTGGSGIGIDRLVMYLTNAANIKDVILFPAMKPE